MMGETTARGGLTNASGSRNLQYVVIEQSTSQFRRDYLQIKSELLNTRTFDPFA